MNIAKVVEYYDPITPQSWKVVIGDYLIKVLHEKQIDENSVELVIYGDEKNVKDFEQNATEGFAPRLQLMAISISNSDYCSWLYNEIYAFDQLTYFQNKEDESQAKWMSDEYCLDPLNEENI